MTAPVIQSTAIAAADQIASSAQRQGRANQSSGTVPTSTADELRDHEPARAGVIGGS